MIFVLKGGLFEAEIIIGLTETKIMHQKHITGHMHGSQGIQQNRPDVLL